MAKILFFAHDPGGGNALTPLIASLKAKGHQVFIFAQGPSMSILPGAIHFDGNTDELIRTYRPNLVLTGTSASNMTEKNLRTSAKKFAIPSISILDHWVNFGIRFSKYTTKEKEAYDRNRIFDFLPDFIVVMDEYAKKEMVKEGIPNDIIYPLGNPHFKFLKDSIENLKTNELKKELLNGKNHLIIFASEPYTEDYGKGAEIDCLKDIISLLPKTTRLLVKPHPREKRDKFHTLNEYLLPTTISSQQAIKCADIIISMTSMLLIESLIVGKKIISYQKNETDPTKFILTKMNAIPFINDKIGLKKELDNISNNKTFYNFEVKLNATENIIKFIEEKLCQN